MKTQSIKITFFLFLFIILLVSVSFANENHSKLSAIVPNTEITRETVFENNPPNNADAPLAEYSPATEKNQFSTYEKVIEDEITIESWMTSDQLFRFENTNNSTAIEESPLTIEKWMYDDQSWKIN